MDCAVFLMGTEVRTSGHYPAAGTVAPCAMLRLDLKADQIRIHGTTDQLKDLVAHLYDALGEIEQQQTAAERACLSEQAKGEKS